MRAVLVAPICGVLAGCGLVSGLDDLKVCATCDAGSPEASSEGGGADATDDADAVGPWSVTSVSGLALWLNASVGVTATANVDPALVTSWADQSGNHNDATQPISSRQPTLVASSINGLPTIHFTSNVASSNSTGSQLVIADSISLQWGTNPYYVAVVAKFDNNPADFLVAGLGTLYAKPTSATTVALALAANVGGWSGSNFQPGFEGIIGTTTAASPGPYNDGTPHLFTCRRTATDLSSSVDSAPGAAIAISKNVDVSAVGNKVVIGSVADGADARLDGDIAEMIAVQSPLDADITKIEGYLRQRYKTP